MLRNLGNLKLTQEIADYLQAKFRWYALHGDERESVQNAKQGSSASGKTLNT